MKFTETCPHCGHEIEVRFFAETSTSDLPVPKNKAGGFVYLIYSPSNDLYKIGRTKKVDGRYGTIAKQSPVAIELIHSFESMNASKAEAELHKRFSGSRVRGEWFNLDEKDVEYICSIQDGAL